jgi:hypothetical protein
VNFATGGSTVNGTPAASWNVVVPSPENGNTLIAAINVHGSASPAVTSITQAGATWVRAAYSANPGSCESEIWYTTNLVNAGTNVTITTSAAWRSAAVIAEYRGLATINALDVTASSSNSGSAASTGTTATTSQASELWFGCVGLSSSAYTLDTSPFGVLGNGFTLIESAESDNSTANGNGAVNVVEKFATATGNAGCSATISQGWIGAMVTRVSPWSGVWSGVMAAFKITQTNTPLALSGTAAANYYLTEIPGTVDISAKPLTVIGFTANNKVYDGTAAATLNKSSAALIGNLDGMNVTLNTNNAVGFFLPDGSVGTNKTVQVSGLTISGSATNNYLLVQPTTTASVAAFNAAMSSSGNPTTVSFAGNPGASYVTDRSTNLVTWKSISTNAAPTTGQVIITDAFLDLGGLQPSTAYYRVHLP